MREYHLQNQEIPDGNWLRRGNGGFDIAWDDG